MSDASRAVSTRLRDTGIALCLHETIYVDSLSKLMFFLCVFCNGLSLSLLKRDTDAVALDFRTLKNSSIVSF